LARVKAESDFNLELFDGYFVTTDEYQYILNKRGKNGKGEDKVDTIGYYTKLQFLIRDLANKQLRKADIKSLDDLYRGMERIEKKINKLVPEFEVTRN
jgi:hypothetical protein